MLKIHKPFSKRKLFFLGITSICIASGLCALSYLTYTPELSHAETVSYRSLDDITYMQEMTAAICKASVENETKQLIDSRDGKSYWATKLNDGNCWMTQNLDLDIPAEGLKAKDTDIPADWNSNSTYKPEVTQITANPNFGNSNNNIKSWDPALGKAATYCNDGTIAGKCKQSGNPTTSVNNGHDAQGNYYSWGAATAGQAASLTVNEVVKTTQSICPKGWRLPTGGENGEFHTLLGDLTIDTILTQPYSFVYGGRVTGSTLNNVQGYSEGGGYYWSSIGFMSEYAYRLYFGTDINSRDDGIRSHGHSVRCIARTEPEETRTLANIEYMQDITAEICANTPEATADGKFQYQLKDSRDQKTYWVAKLKDNNCWMTQNLDLDLYVDGVNRKLTSADSDVASDWTSTTGASRLWTGDSSNYNIARYYNPGEYAYANPTNRLNGGCGMLSSTTCANAGWKPMSGASTDDSRNEITHYLAGNYYSWGAATAGQAANIGESGESTQSICPKEWKLPINSGDKSYGTLLSSYGTNSGLLYGTQDIRLNPLYFVYGGYVRDSSLNSTGSQGFYWSSTTSDSDFTNFTYNMLFDTSVSPSNRSLRYHGFSVRCVSPGGEKQNYNNVEITINPQLSLDIANEVVVEKTEPNPSTATLDAKVSSNMPYIISISSNNPDLASSTSSTIIPATSGLLNTAVNGWGIKKYNTAGTEESTYTAITKDFQTFYTASGAEIKTIPFTIGISTAPDIPNGEYSTDITVTATQN